MRRWLTGFLVTLLHTAAFSLDLMGLGVGEKALWFLLTKAPIPSQAPTRMTSPTPDHFPQTLTSKYHHLRD